MGYTVRVAMAHWSGDRGLAIIDKLASLRDAGCKVELLVSKDIHIGSTYKYSDVAKRIAAKKLVTYAFPPDLAGNMHAKYLIVNAPYDGDSLPSKLVFFGSHNFSEAAHFRNDETWIKLTNSHSSFMFDAFTASFIEMKNRILNALPATATLHDVGDDD
jgi:phosphatidylserine/phosphatidylglycerophosphate/cardiolipin synthase-like enzyme